MRRYAPTHARFCPAAWFPFCMTRYVEKKKHLNFRFTSQNDLKFQPSMRANIPVTLL